MSNKIKKVKRTLFGIGLTIMAIPTKILAMTVPDPTSIVALYGPPPIEDSSHLIWECIQICTIPIALLIGLIVYFRKKKKSEEKVSKKPIIISLIIGIILFFAVWALYNI